MRALRLFWSLLLVQLRQQYRPSPERRGQRRGQALAYVALAFAFFTLSSQLWSFFLMMERVGVSQGVSGLGLHMGVMGSMVVALGFGTLYTLSATYYARDLPRLMPLPISPAAILAAKVLLVVLSQLVTMVFFFWPAALAFGAVHAAPWLYWLRALLVFLFLPIIPLAVATLLSLAIMNLTRGRFNRDSLRVLFTFFFLALVLGFQVGLRNYIGGQVDTAQPMLETLTGPDGLVAQVGRLFPPAAWAAAAIRGSLPHLGLYLMASAGVGAAAMALANRFFFPAALAGQESAPGPRPGRGRMRAPQELVAALRPHAPLVALFWREVRLFFRTPAFVMQGLAGLVLMPFFMLLPLVQSRGLEGALGLMQRPGVAPWVVLGGMAAVQVLLSLMAIAATAITREGPQFWIAQVLPVPPRLQVQAKLLHTLTISAGFVAVVAAILAGIGRAGALDLAVFVVGSLLGAVIGAELGLMVDLWNPQLDWTDPHRAMKNNFNGLWATVIHLLVVLVLGAVTGFVAAGGRFSLAYAVALGGQAAVSLALFPPLMQMADRRYPDIQG